MPPTPSRTLKRAAVIAGLIVLAVALDAATGLNVLMAGSCLGYMLLQLLAMTAGVLVAIGGLAVWIFSRFTSDKALYAAVSAIGLVIAALLVRNVFTLIGLTCIG